MTRPVVEMAVASWTLAGQGECGDLYLVEPYDNGVLLAVVDGIGHGAEAAKVAKIAVAILKDRPHDLPSILIRECHESLRATRGAVLALASFNAVHQTMCWTGVGNVEGKLFSADRQAAPKTLLSSPGTLGHGTVEVRPDEIPIRIGNTLILATDGVRHDFYLGLDIHQSPQEIADHILARSARRSDDALVLVARYTG